MNIIELAREAGFDWHSGWTLDDDEPNRFVTFAAAVIAAHTEELIEGVGEPVAYKTDDVELYVREEKFGFYDIPLYTASQVAGAVAKAKQERDKELIESVGEPAHHIMVDGKCIGYYSAEQAAAAVAKREVELIETNSTDALGDAEERIAELESERDMWKATAEAVVDFEKSQMRLRITELESTLKVALEVLAINQYAVADQAPHKDVMNYNATIEKIEEVLHD